MPQDLLFCPHCGGRNAPGARFCEHCGQPMDAATPSAAGPGPVTAGPGPVTAAAAARRRPWFLTFTLVVAALIGLELAAIAFPKPASQLLAPVKALISGNRGAPRQASRPAPPARTPQPVQPVQPSAPPPQPALPAAPVQPPAPSQPALPATPVQPPQPQPPAVSVVPRQPAQPAIPAATRVSLRTASAARVPVGQPAKFTLTFEFAGTKPTPAKALLAVRQPDGSLHYAALSEFAAVPGHNEKTLQFTPEAKAAGTELPVYGEVQIGGQTYLSSAARVAIAPAPRAAAPVAPPAPPRPAPASPPPPPAQPSPAPTPPAPPLGAPTPGGKNPPAPAPSSPPAPAVEPGGPGRMRLVPTTVLKVPPGGTVSFNFTFDFDAADRMTVENAIAWRETDGSLHYGTFRSVTVTRGPNTIRGLGLRVGTGVRPGTTYPVYGALRINGKTYRSQVAVIITVIPGR